MSANSNPFLKVSMCTPPNIVTRAHLKMPKCLQRQTGQCWVKVGLDSSKRRDVARGGLRRYFIKISYAHALRAQHN